MSQKRCPKCNTYKDLDSFFKSKQLKDGYSCWCRECNRQRNKKEYYRDHEAQKAKDRKRRNMNKEYENAYAREYYHKNKDRQRNYHLKKCYGIVQADYERMMNYQDHKCAICSEELGKKLFIDHNHETGEVRGLLCHHCNSLLGYARDKAEILDRAMDYLTDFPAQFVPLSNRAVGSV